MAQAQHSASFPDERGRFGEYGGKFVPETLMAALNDLEAAYIDVQLDQEFNNELTGLLINYVGRSTPLTFASSLTEALKGAKIYLKREDLAHTGAHKINNALGQALLAKRMGKSGSLRRRVQVNMVWRRQLRVLCLIWNALFIWVRKTFNANH